nr:hypothetical protein [Tanacetum cinerariifolium]
FARHYPCIDETPFSLIQDAVPLSQAMEAQIRAVQRDVSVLQRPRIDDGDRLTSHIQHEHDSVSLLLTSPYSDGTHKVTPRVSAMARCDTSRVDYGFIDTMDASI